MTNPHEHYARSRKVTAIIEHLLDTWSACPPERRQWHCADILDGWPQSARDLIAQQAGVRSPSTHTWRLVTDGFQQRIDRIAHRERNVA